MLVGEKVFFLYAIPTALFLLSLSLRIVIGRMPTRDTIFKELLTVPLDIALLSAPVLLDILSSANIMAAISIVFFYVMYITAIIYFSRLVKDFFKNDKRKAAKLSVSSIMATGSIFQILCVVMIVIGAE
jgi:amino acid transporter